MTKEYLSEIELEKWRESNYLLDRSKKDFQKISKSIKKVIKAPASMDINIWCWDMKCYACHKLTPVIFPDGEFFGYSVDYESLTNLQTTLAKKYPFYKMTVKKTQNVEAYGNRCVHCDAYQGDYFVFEEYLEIAYEEERLKEKIIISVPLTYDERIYYAQPERE